MTLSWLDTQRPWLETLRMTLTLATGSWLQHDPVTYCTVLQRKKHPIAGLIAIHSFQMHQNFQGDQSDHQNSEDPLIHAFPNGPVASSSSQATDLSHKPSWLGQSHVQLLGHAVYMCTYFSRDCKLQLRSRFDSA